jgi:hypothetical protein
MFNNNGVRNRGSEVVRIRMQQQKKEKKKEKGRKRN